MNKKVAIIGGGFSGLVLSYKLSKLGYSVTIYEKEKKNGGLLQTVKTRGGHQIEKAYHHFFKYDHELIDLLEELGLTKNIIWAKSSTSIYNKSFYGFSGLSDLFKYPNINFVSKIRFILSTWIISKFKLNYYTNKSAKELIIKMFGDQSWKNIWQPLFVGKFSKHSDRIGAKWFQSRIIKRASSRKNSAELLGYLSGSFQTLTNKLEFSIKAYNGKIFNTKNINKIIYENNKFIIDHTKYDILISTISSEQIGFFSFLSDDEISKLKKIEYLAAICCLIESPKKITDYYWNNIIDKDSPFVAIIEQTNLISESNYSNTHLIYLIKYIQKTDPILKLSDIEIINIWLDYLKKVNPGIVTKQISARLFRLASAQPIMQNDYVPLENITTINNFFITSLAHIYPDDRGLNEAVKEADKIIKIIDN